MTQIRLATCMWPWVIHVVRQHCTASTCSSVPWSTATQLPVYHAYSMHQDWHKSPRRPSSGLRYFGAALLLQICRYSKTQCAAASCVQSDARHLGYSDRALTSLVLYRCCCNAPAHTHGWPCRESQPCHQCCIMLMLLHYYRHPDAAIQMQQSRAYCCNSAPGAADKYSCLGQPLF